MRFSFIHTADIHLGRPFTDISETGFEKKFSNAGIESFCKIIDIAISKKVDFVLIAGDSFDNEEHDLSAKLCFIRNLIKLADNGIKSYVICGNHDPVELYRNFHSYFKFDEKYKGIINITGITTDSYKEIFSPIENVNIHSISFETEEMGNPAKELVSVDAEMSKKFNIGLIHCDVDKTSSKYAPTTREDLRNLGYDYYALGHIHKSELKEEKIVYAGTPQGRTKKETGAHGCYLVEVNENKIVSQEFIPTDFVRFESVDVDCSDCQNKMEVFDEITEKLSDNKSETELQLFEINLKGISKAFEELNSDENLLKEYLENFYDNSKNYFIYEINNLTIPLINEEEMLEDNGVIGIILKAEEKGINIENIYNDVAKIHENIYKKLDIDSESKTYLLSTLLTEKEEILEQAEKEIKSLCSEIYNLE